MERALWREGTNSPNMNYEHAILSDRMGVHPNQVAGHRRMFPKIPMNDAGQIVVRNGAEERMINRELKAAFSKPDG